MLNRNHFKQCFALAAPIILAQLVITINNFASTIMLSHLGHHVLAASALLFAVTTTLTVVFISILFASGILISRLFGAKEYQQIGQIAQQSWLFGIFLSIFVMVIYWFIKPLLLLCGQKPEIINIIIPYFHYAIFSLPPLFINITSKQLCNAVHKQTYGLISSCINVATSLSLGYLLIFNKIDLGVHGVAGWGLAVTIANWLSAGILMSLLVFNTYFEKFQLFTKHAFNEFKFIKQIFRIGWPMCIQTSSELMSLFVLTLMVGWMTNIDLAAMQISQQYILFILIPVFGFSTAAGILVGRAHGGNNINEIRHLSSANIILATGYLAVISLLFVLFHSQLINVFLPHKSQHYQQTFNLTYIVLLIRLLALLFDNTRNILSGSLRGLLDSRFPMIASIITIWIIRVPLAYIFTFTFGWGLIGLSWSGVIGMLIGATLLYWRWRKLTTLIANQEVATSNH